MSWIARLSLAQRFSLLSFVLIFGAMFVLGTWIGKQIETRVISQTADLTALYVDSLLTHHLQVALRADATSTAHAAEVRELLEDSPLGRNLAAYKIWSTEGRILYSSEPAIIGQQFPIEGGMAEALKGSVHAEISSLQEPEESSGRQRWSRLIETYAPMIDSENGEIIGVIEFYQPTDALAAEIRAARIRSWLGLSTSAVVIFLLLVRLIYGASRTITRQQNELQEKVAQLSTLLDQNKLLHSRVSRAAARTATLNERFLSRISADLHDGPAQDLALALLRIDELAKICESCRVTLRKKGAAGQDFQLIRTALTSALADLRSTLAGLRLPEIDELPLGKTAERAIRDFEDKTGRAVTYSAGAIPDQAPLSVKITLYRILQEALSNGYRHADGAGQHVTIEHRDGHLWAEITDNGNGFDPQAVSPEHLGLVGMRERVEILGGIFETESSPGRGTVIRTRLPLRTTEDADG